MNINTTIIVPKKSFYTTKMDEISTLSVELICHILSFLQIDDIATCMSVSKRLRNIITYNRLDATVVIKNNAIYKSSSRFPGKKEYVGSTDWFFRTFSNITMNRLEFYDQMPKFARPTLQLALAVRSYKIKEIFIKPCCGEMLWLLMNNKANQFPLLTTLQLTMRDSFDLNELSNLPLIAPNLQSLEVCNFNDNLFEGTESFNQLQNICLGDDRSTAQVSTINSFVRMMPKLTSFNCTRVDFDKKSGVFFEALPRLERIHLKNVALFTPIRSRNETLKELSFTGAFGVALVVEKHIHLTHVETFKSKVRSRVVDWTQLIGYYGVGRNLKTLYIEYAAKLPLLTCSTLPNLENLYAPGSRLSSKHLDRICDVCTKLVIASFFTITNIKKGGYNIGWITKGTIKILFLKKLAKQEVECLIERGIDVYIEDKE